MIPWPSALSQAATGWVPNGRKLLRVEGMNQGRPWAFSSGVSHPFRPATAGRKLGRLQVVRSAPQLPCRGIRLCASLMSYRAACTSAFMRERAPLVPATTAVIAATANEQDDQKDDEECGGIHYYSSALARLSPRIELK